MTKKCQKMTKNRISEFCPTFFRGGGAPNPAKRCFIWFLGTKCVVPDSKISPIRAQPAYIWNKSVFLPCFSSFPSSFWAICGEMAFSPDQQLFFSRRRPYSIVPTTESYFSQSGDVSYVRDSILHGLKSSAPKPCKHKRFLGSGPSSEPICSKPTH